MVQPHFKVDSTGKNVPVKQVNRSNIWQRWYHILKLIGIVGLRAISAGTSIWWAKRQVK